MVSNEFLIISQQINAHEFLSIFHFLFFFFGTNANIIQWGIFVCARIDIILFTTMFKTIFLFSNTYQTVL